MLAKAHQDQLPKNKSNKTLRISLMLGVLFVIVGTLLLLVKFPSLPPQVPLFYSKPWGEERIPSKIWLSLIPVLSFFILAFNFFILPRFLKEEKFLITVLYLTSTISLFLLLWTLIQIIFLVS